MNRLILTAVACLMFAGAAHADVFTIGKHDANNLSGWAYYIGQTFTPNVQGVDGAGAIPTDQETVYLHSFKVFPWDEQYDPVPVPETAYIYPAALMSLDSDTAETGLYSLAEGTHTGDGLYEFEPFEVDLDQTYAFVMTEAASVLYWESSPYEGGEAYWTDGSTIGTNYDILDFHSDLDFEATFSTDGVIPEPASLALLGLGGLTLLRRRRA